MLKKEITLLLKSKKKVENSQKNWRSTSCLHVNIICLTYSTNEIFIFDIKSFTSNSSNILDYSFFKKIETKRILSFLPFSLFYHNFHILEAACE